MKKYKIETRTGNGVTVRYTNEQPKCFKWDYVNETRQFYPSNIDLIRCDDSKKRLSK